MKKRRIVSVVSFLLCLTAFVLVACTPKKYTVTFDLNGAAGTVPVAQTVAKNGLATKPTDPIRENYDFRGWFLTADGTGSAWDFTSNQVNDNTTLYAKWTAVSVPPAVTFSLTFNLNGASGTPPTAQTVASGEKANAPAEPARDGFNFGGWFNNAACTGTAWNFDTNTVSAATVLYAKWTATTPTVTTYSVTFNLNGASGNAPTAQTVASGEKATVPTVPAREHYIFGGWFNNAACMGTAWNFDTNTVSTATVLYAKWTEKTVTSLRVTTPPNNLAYLTGDNFDPTGLVIEKVYSDGTATEVPLSAFSFPSGLYPNQTVSVELGAITCSIENISIHDPRNLVATALRIKNQPAYTKQLIGNSLNTEGVVLEKQTAEFGDRWISVGIDEVQLNTFDLTQTGNLTVTATLNNVSASFDIEVVAVPTTVPTELLLNTADAYTTFFVGETFNLGELRASLVYEDGVRIPALDAELSINGSENSLTTTAGTYSVTVTHQSTQLTATYEITVSTLPDITGDWYCPADKSTSFLPNDEFVFQITKEHDVFQKTEYTIAGNFGLDELTREQLIMNRESKTDYCIYTTNHGSVIYDPASGRMTLNNIELQKKTPSDVVVLFRSTLTDMMYDEIKELAYIARNGHLTQSQIDATKNIGELLSLTPEYDGSQLVTPETTLTASTKLYLITIPVDYTGEQFLGNFDLDGSVITITKNQIIMMGQTFPYTASYENGKWYLHAANAYLCYDPALDSISPSNTAEAHATRVDSSKNAVVTLRTADNSLSTRIVVAKGSSISSITIANPTLTKIVFESYNGELITQDCEIIITNILTVWIGDLPSITLGAFERNFRFEEILGGTNGTVVMNCSGTETTGSYEIVDLQDEYTLNIQMELDGKTTNAVILLDNGQQSLQISGSTEYDGVYSYIPDSFYENAPFCTRFTNDDNAISDTVSLYENGSISFSSSGYYSYRAVLKSNQYEITFVNDQAEEITATFSADTRKLTVGAATYTADPVYYGQYYYRGQCIDIQSTAYATISDAHYNITNVTDNGTTVTLTLTLIGETAEVSIVYNKDAQTLTFQNNAFVERDLYFYNSGYYQNGDHKIHFDFPGFIYSVNDMNEETIIGEVTLTRNESFNYVLYADPTTVLSGQIIENPENVVIQMNGASYSSINP